MVGANTTSVYPYRSCEIPRAHVRANTEKMSCSRTQIRKRCPALVVSPLVAVDATARRSVCVVRVSGLGLPAHAASQETPGIAATLHRCPRGPTPRLPPVIIPGGRQQSRRLSNALTHPRHQLSVSNCPPSLISSKLLVPPLSTCPRE